MTNRSPGGLNRPRSYRQSFDPTKLLSDESVHLFFPPNVYECILFPIQCNPLQEGTERTGSTLDQPLAVADATAHQRAEVIPPAGRNGISLACGGASDPRQKPYFGKLGRVTLPRSLRPERGLCSTAHALLSARHRQAMRPAKLES